jgi:hypothetical protein
VLRPRCCARWRPSLVPAKITVAEFAWAVKHDRIGNYSPRGKPNRNRFGRSLPRRTLPWLTLRGGTSVT